MMIALLLLMYVSHPNHLLIDLLTSISHFEHLNGPFGHKYSFNIRCNIDRICLCESRSQDEFDLLGELFESILVLFVVYWWLDVDGILEHDVLSVVS